MRAILGSGAKWITAHRPAAVFSLVVCGLYWAGTRLPVPGVNAGALAFLAADVPTSGLGFYDLFTGGNLARVTVLALGVMPCVTTLCVVYVLTALGLWRAWAGPRGRVARWGLALVLTVVQSTAIALWLEQ
jgi:preprotein translocase subunit SecY